MQIIQHRINMREQLGHIPEQYGVEIDVRYHNERLVLWHDAFHHPQNTPCDFEEWLEDYHQKGPLILNLKTEGIENACIALMQKYKIHHYFFLDMSMPYFVQYAQKTLNGEIEGFCAENLAVRFSEHEPIEYALSFAGQVGWVWVDCFSYLPLDKNILQQFKEARFRLCLVSPELQKHDVARIAEFKNQLQKLGYVPDAVCTKRPDLWRDDA